MQHASHRLSGTQGIHRQQHDSPHRYRTAVTATITTLCLIIFGLAASRCQAETPEPKHLPLPLIESKPDTSLPKAHISLILDRPEPGFVFYNDSMQEVSFLSYDAIYARNPYKGINYPTLRSSSSYNDLDMSELNAEQVRDAMPPGLRNRIPDSVWAKAGYIEWYAGPARHRDMTTFLPITYQILIQNKETGTVMWTESIIQIFDVTGKVAHTIMTNRNISTDIHTLLLTPEGKYLLAIEYFQDYLYEGVYLPMALLVYNVQQQSLVARVSCQGTNFIPDDAHGLPFRTENGMFLGHALKYYCEPITYNDCLDHWNMEDFCKVIIDPANRIIYYKPDTWQPEGMPRVFLQSPTHPDGEDLSTYQSCSW